MITEINNVQSFKGGNLSPKDLSYKCLLQKGLKDTFEISCKIEDLDSIAGPDELRIIIQKLKPEQYKIGDDCKANFHLHTKVSDGALSPKDFLEQCRDWTLHILKSKKSSNDLPAFSAAVTDHNKIDGVKDVIALIVQNPKLYKGFKFVSGCEYLMDGYRKPYPAFEAIGLGFNPFDKNLQGILNGVDKIINVKDIKKNDANGILSWAHPIVTPNKINEDFFQFLKQNGIGGVEGNYQYCSWNKEYIASFKPMLDKLIKDFKMFVTGGTDSHRKTIF